MTHKNINFVAPNTHVRVMIWFVFVVGVAVVSSGCTPTRSTVPDRPDAADMPTPTERISPPVDQEQPTVLTPEEVLARMDAEEGVGVEQWPIGVTITSPVEPTFIPWQARMYEAAIAGVATGRRCRCDRSFYLDQYAEEALYETMPDRQCTPKNDALVCAFTHTFIRDRGDLRVRVDVEVIDRADQVVATGSAEATYKVQ